MPTGLTAEIYDGTDMSFRRFALKCYTQFNAGYRASNYGEDELPFDKAPVLEVRTYYLERAKKTKEQVEKLEKAKKNPEVLVELYEKAKNESKSHTQERVEKSDTIRQRYDKMIEKVEKWNAPEEYQSLKDSMLKQLRESKSYDCYSGIDAEDELYPSIDEWYELNITQAKRLAESAAAEAAEEIKKVEEYNQQLKGLYECLDKVEPCS